MTKIFVNDKPIVLSTTVDESDGFKNYKLKKVRIGKVIKQLKKKNVPGVRLVHKNENKLLKKFLKKLPNVVAAGGKVYNDKGETLFIYRNNKWDLPKGKVEKHEPISKAAVREVEEETGVTGLEIIKPLEITYHIFRRNGKNKVKITYWFEMKTSYNGTLQPQEKEGITEVKWLDEKTTEMALANSYANIKLLV